MPKSSKSTDPSIPPRSFEAALEELESTVERMEAGELSLEQSLAAHKRGLVLVQYCQSALSQARQQVQVLEGDVLTPVARRFGIEPQWAVPEPEISA